MTKNPGKLIVTTLGELIRQFACVSVRPMNLEHCQSHCAYVHDACYQAVFDDDLQRYSPQASETFPYVANIEDCREDVLRAWPDRFWIWFISLSESDRAELKKEMVVPLPFDAEALLAIG